MKAKKLRNDRGASLGSEIAFFVLGVGLNLVVGYGIYRGVQLLSEKVGSFLANPPRLEGTAAYVGLAVLIPVGLLVLMWLVGELCHR
jgi:hypothetical protein